MVVVQNITSTKTTRYLMSNVFVTGCDHNTEWQLPWFLENFERYNDTKLIIADFGIMNYPDGDYTYIDMSRNKFHIRTFAANVLVSEEEHVSEK